jgi:hypothetical protein
MKQLILPLVMLALLLGLSYSSYHTGKADAQLECLEHLHSTDSTQRVIDSLCSEISVRHIDLGRMELLYSRACEKLTQSEIEEIETGIE